MQKETDKDRARLSVDEDDMRSLVECPICVEIPRDGVMLLCANGHKVCPTCKAKLGNKAKCPQGRCDFNAPPTRDRTVAGLVNRVPFNWPCKYSKVTKIINNKISNITVCQFEGAKNEIECHEAECPHRLVPCLDGTCEDLLPLDQLLEHCETAHGFEVVAPDTTTPSSVEMRRLWNESWIDDTVDWDPSIVNTPLGHVFARVRYQAGEVFLWLTLIGDVTQAGRLSAKISLSNASKSMSYTSPSPVYPVDWSVDRIVRDGRCVRINMWNVRQTLMADYLSQEEKNDGHSGVFVVDFNVDIPT